jgi:hypothetical protein
MTEQAETKVQAIDGAALTPMDDAAVAEALAPEDPLAGLTPEETEVGAKLLPILSAKIAKESDVFYGKKYKTSYDSLVAANQEALKKAIDEVRESLKPLTDAEVSKMLEQEYGEYDLKLKGPNGEVTFTIRELSISREKKIVKAIKKAIAPVLKTISSAEWESMVGASSLERVDRITDLVPEAMDVLCECVAICLDPRGEEPFMTPEWVAENMGLPRIITVLNAQINASRYRDFMSLAYRLFRQARMTQ